MLLSSEVMSAWKSPTIFPPPCRICPIASMVSCRCFRPRLYCWMYWPSRAATVFWLADPNWSTRFCRSPASFWMLDEESSIPAPYLLCPSSAMTEPLCSLPAQGVAEPGRVELVVQLLRGLLVLVVVTLELLLA